MFKKFKKPIVYLLTALMVMPAYLWMTLATAPEAHAAVTEIIIDDGDTGFSLDEPGSAVWDYQNDGSGYTGDYYSEDNTTTNKHATWRPTIIRSGNYEVFAHWSASPDRPSNVIYTVADNGGNTNITINQKKKADNTTVPAGNVESGWKSLGVYDFDAGSDGFVRIAERSSGNTCADAVKFVKANTPPTAPALQSPALPIIEATGSNILLTWTAAFDGESDPLQYEIMYDSVSLGLTSNLSQSVPEVVGAHTWKARAFDGSDYGSWSSESTFTIQDSIPPILTLNGDNPLNWEAGNLYVDPGATATDIVSGDLTGSILINHSVNSSALGNYPVSFSISDGAGNTSNAVRTVNVVDHTGPVIDSVGSSPDTTGEPTTITVAAHDTMGVASAQININGAGYVPMIGSGPYTYPIALPATSTTPVNYSILLIDTQGNATERTSLSIIPRDNDAPVITSVTGNAGHTGGTTLVTVGASDNIGATRAEILVGIGSWVPMSGSSSPFTFNVPIPLNPASDISYSVMVYDAANNYVLSGSHIINVSDVISPAGSVIVSNDEVYANNANVNLSISGTDNIAVTEMCISNSSSCSDWVPFAASYAWALEGADGTKTVHVWLRDAAQNSSVELTDSIILDTEGPTTPGTPTPNVSNPTNVVNHLWTWAASSDVLSGLKGYWLKVTGSFSQDWTWWGSETSASSSSFFEGLYSIFIKAEDNARNMSQESSYTLVVDTTAPVSTLNPSAVNPTSSNNISYSGFASDPSSTTIAGIQYRIDGAGWNELNPADAAFDSAIEAINFTTGMLSDGSHLIEVRAYDAAGNYQPDPYSSDNIVVDTTEPTTTDNIDGIWHNGPVTVTLTCNDGTGTGCANTYYSVDGLPYATYAAPFDITAAGIHSLRYYSTDAVNNTETEKNAANNIKIDSVAPTSVISSSGLYGPNTWAGQVAGVASDPNEVFGSGVASVHVEITDPAMTEVVNTDAILSGGNWSLAVSPSLFTIDGTYQIYALANDNAGNIQVDPAIGSFVWDATGPTITPVEDGKIYDSAQTITVADENGIASVALNGKDFDTSKAITANGKYDLIATDSLGNQTEVKFTIDIAPVIINENSISVTTTSATITWTTDQPATSRVVYGASSISDASAAVAGSPNYGYAYSTTEFDSIIKVTSHSVFINGLTPGTIYYFRAVSHGSPEAIGPEISFATSVAPVTAAIEEAPAAPAPAPAAVSTVKPAPVNAATTTTPSDDQGQIKGDESATNTEEENGVNWTPWIILFILIILAGAATGGYFYWFAGDDDDDDEKEKSEPKVKAKAPVAPAKAAAKPAAKSNNKKSKRW